MPRRLPNLNALRTFEAAARHLTFQNAAGELHVTQGAVAQQVRRLEADLGTPLFTRHARGLSLTEAGKQLYPVVQRALTDIAKTIDTIRPEKARLTISVPPSFASKWLVPRLPRFHAQHPEIDLTVHASAHLSELRDPSHLAIRQGKRPIDPSLGVHRISGLGLVAVTGGGLAAALPDRATLEDISSYPLIQDGHRAWDAVFKAAGLSTPKKEIVFNQTDLALDAAANGLGIALVPEAYLGGTSHTVLWRQPNAGSEGFFLLRPKSGATSDDANKVVAWLLAEANHSFGRANHAL